VDVLRDVKEIIFWHIGWRHLVPSPHFRNLRKAFLGPVPQTYPYQGSNLSYSRCELNVSGLFN